MCGCSTISQLYADYPKQVALMQDSYAVAVHTSLAYISRPTCGKTTAIICKDPAIEKKMAVYEGAAYTAIKAARVAEDETAIQAAQTALDAFKQISDGKVAP